MLKRPRKGLVGSHMHAGMSFYKRQYLPRDITPVDGFSNFSPLNVACQLSGLAKLQRTLALRTRLDVALIVMFVIRVIRRLQSTSVTGSSSLQFVAVISVILGCG